MILNPWALAIIAIAVFAVLSPIGDKALVFWLLALVAVTGAFTE